MIQRILVIVLLLATPAFAGKRKVLVLPLDGNAPADTRVKLSASFQKMARVLDGDVQAGNTSLGDTAAAIGCDPATPKCVENVRATLGVDELVYGTADEKDGTIVVVAKRYTKGKPPRELTVTQPSAEPPNKIEPQLLPVFGNDALPGSGTPDPNTNTNTNTPDPNANPNPEPQQPEGPSKRGRNIWIGVTAGGGLLVVLGLALWQQAGDLQDDIDNANPADQRALDALEDTESKATKRAWTGNVFVVLGLGVAAYGGYRLWKWAPDKELTVTPTPIEGGAAVTLGGRW